MHEWKSNKTVEAGKIANVNRVLAQVQLTDHEVVTVTDKWFNRYEEHVDDMGYLVRYADGFLSWSPTQAFENGYTRMTDLEAASTPA